MLFLDLDDFKIVNDSLGHDAGDRLLRQVARRLRHTVRPQDTVTRFGGDEFVVLCPDLPDAAAVDRLCRRLLAVLSEPVEVDGRPVGVGASIGVATADPTSTPTSMLRDADAAMYAAKRGGRNRYAVSDELLRGFTLAALTEEADLRAALERRELELHVQPVRRLSTLAPAAVEALLRWRHPVRGPLAPAHAVGLARRSGLGRELGAFVLDEACRRLAGWRAESRTPRLRVHVNLDSEHLEDDAVIDDVRIALHRHGVDPTSLVVEVPERALLDDYAGVVTHLDALVELGVRVLIDDFGTGYAPLSALRRLPATALKLDRVFVAGAADSERDGRLLRSIAAMGASLGMSVVAAGIETPEQLRVARAAGCSHAQGYLLGQPGPAATWDAADLPVGGPAGGGPDGATVLALPRRR